MSARDSTAGWGDWPTWLDTATETPACRDYPTDLFFPGQKGGQKQVELAKAVCAGCPLLAPCEAWALGQPAHQLYGVWGGTTTNERRNLAAPTGAQPAQFRKTNR